MRLRRPSRLLWLAAFVAIEQVSLPAGPTPAVNMATVQTPFYLPDGPAFVSKNSPRFNNRPLYGHENYSVVIAGDRPFLRLGTGKDMNGAFMVAILRGGTGQWLHDFAEVESRYVGGRMEWTATDPAFPGLVVRYAAAALAEGAGLTARLSTTGAKPGDRLVWASGGAVTETQSTLWRYDLTTFGRDAMMKASFDPASAAGNSVRVDGPRWSVFPGPTAEEQSARRDGQEWGPKDAGARGLSGVCDLPGELRVVAAEGWSSPLTLPTAAASTTAPLVCAVAPLPADRTVYWLLRAGADTPAAQLAPSAAAAAFDAAVARSEAVSRQIIVETPDPRLDAAVAASAVAYRATFRDSVFTHSGMRWGVPLLGWRTLFGATAYGWHEQVLAQARVCLARQVKTDDTRTVAVPDPAKKLASQSPLSRLFGKGRVAAYHPNHYDMQSQFFDQLVHAWRWTGSAELETLLRPALELHLEYIQECFDPDLDGTYESYLNTWPTDGTWFSGGGTAEQTAYAHRGHAAARDLARRAGDTTAVTRHTTALARIETGFQKLLWVADKGHVGAYREQGGLKRLHESSWLYCTFCAIDAQLLSPEQAPSALYYTEWALERLKMPYGGEQVWPSNWVPSIWSVRQIWPGDSYHLALAYFQTGLGADAWKLFSGTFPHYMQYGPVPGDLGHPAGGTDFNDCSSTFCRTVVEGLFGFAPDRPNGRIRIAPQFPSDWNRASIRTPDFSLRFTGSTTAARYDLTLADPAAVEFIVPVHANRIARVTLDGRPARFTVRPGFGRSEIVVAVPATAAAAIEVAYAPGAPGAPVELSVVRGAPVVLETPGAKILEWRDPQAVLSAPRNVGDRLLATVASPAGHRLVQLLVERDRLRHWRLFKLHITDPVADAARAAESLASAPASATWHTVDLAPILNGDIRTIFKQEYLTPRAPTVSIRIATDGYSSWQAVLDPKKKVPVIELDRVPTLTGGDGLLRTAQGAAFTRPAEARNVAFASLWDNWPDAVTTAVGRAGEAVWFLVAGSTNPMQVRIANASLVLRYADGVEETVDLVPPFNYWSLTPQGGFDYDYKRDGFALPATPPTQVQLGKNCRAMVLNRRLRPGVVLESVTLRALSEEIIVGLLAVSVQNPAPAKR